MDPTRIVTRWHMVKPKFQGTHLITLRRLCKNAGKYETHPDWPSGHILMKINTGS